MNLQLSRRPLYSISNGRFLLATICLLFTGASTAWAAEFNGTATSPDGKKNGATKFFYDTGNELSGTVLDQATAAALGLGAVDKAGVFTPAKGGTPSIQPMNGAYDLWCFDDVTVEVTDSRGKKCKLKQRVYVAKNKVKGNASLAGESILNAAWINGVMGAQFGAGKKAKAFWPLAPPKKKKAEKKAVMLADTNTGAIQNVFSLNATTGLTGIQQLDFTYESLSEYTFLTQEHAELLGLTPFGTVDLAAVDPESLHSLDWSFSNGTGSQDTGSPTMGQTVFQAVDPFQLQIQLFDEPGIPPLTSQNSNPVLILDGSNPYASDFSVLGSDFADTYGENLGYFNLPDGDLFVLVPEPSTVILGLILVGSFAARYWSIRGRPKELSSA